MFFVVKNKQTKQSNSKTINACWSRIWYQSLSNWFKLYYTFYHFITKYK